MTRYWFYSLSNGAFKLGLFSDKMKFNASLLVTTTLNMWITSSTCFSLTEWQLQQRFCPILSLMTALDTTFLSNYCLSIPPLFLSLLCSSNDCSPSCMFPYTPAGSVAECKARRLENNYCLFASCSKHNKTERVIMPIKVSGIGSACLFKLSVNSDVC